MSDFATTAMQELAPRYRESAIIRTIYQAFAVALGPMLEDRQNAILACRDVDTMPVWLLNAYLRDFGLTTSGVEFTDRQQIKAAIRNLDQRMSIANILKSYGVEEFDADTDSTGTLISVHTVLTVDGEEAAPERIDDAILELIRRRAPAHRIFRYENIGWRTPTFGGIRKYSVDDEPVPCCFGDPDIRFRVHRDVIEPEEAEFAIITQPESRSVQRGETEILLIGVSGAIGNAVSYQWQSSTDGTTWADVPGETNGFLVITVETEMQYRCAVTLDGETLISEAAVLAIEVIGNEENK